MLLIILFLTFSTFYTQVKGCETITEEEGENVNLTLEKGENVKLTLEKNETLELKKIIFNGSMIYYVYENGTIQNDNSNDRTNLIFTTNTFSITIRNITQADEGRYGVEDSETNCKIVKIKKVTTIVTEETTIETKVTTIETKVTSRKTKTTTKQTDSISTPNEVNDDISVWIIGLGSALCVASISVCFLIFYLCRKYMFDGENSKSRRIERILKYRRRQRHLQYNIDRENNIPEDDTDIFEAMIFPPAPPTLPRRERLIPLGVVTEYEIVYAELDLYTPANGQIHGRRREREVVYSDVDFSRTVPSPCSRPS